MVMVRDEPTMQHCNSALTVHGHHEELGRDAQPGNGNIGQLNNNETRAAHAGAARYGARLPANCPPGGNRDPGDARFFYYLNPRACSIQATGFTGATASPGSRVSHTRRSITRNRIPLGGGRAHVRPSG